MKYVSLLAAALALAAGTAGASPVQWTVGSGGNDHWYELIGAQSTLGAAINAAAAQTYSGLSGYLATITSAGEQTFLNSQFNQTAWLGGSDGAVEGTWQWVTGPEAGQVMVYTNWSSNEPNDYGGEDGLLGWWGFNGTWNDIRDDYGSYAVLVEYSPSAVPVPAALPMLGAGLAGLVALRRRKKA